MKKIVIFLVFLLTPFVLLFLLKAIYPLLSSYKEIGSIDGWLGFLGGYVGGIVALFGIWWQLHQSKKREEKTKKEGLIKYLQYEINKNIKRENREQFTYFVQSLFSYTSKNSLKNYDDFLSLFNNDFINENIKIIMELSSISDKLGEEILGLHSDMNKFNKNIEYIYMNLNNKKNIFNEMNNFFKNIPDNDKIYKQYPNLKFEILNSIVIIELLSLIVEKYNIYLKNINNKENNHTRHIHGYNDILRQNIDKTFYGDKFKKELKELINMDFTDEKNNETISKNLNNLLQESIIFFLNDINRKFLFSISDKLLEFEEIHSKFLEFIFVEDNLNGKIFEIYEKLEQLNTKFRTNSFVLNIIKNQ